MKNSLIFLKLISSDCQNLASEFQSKMLLAWEVIIQVQFTHETPSKNLSKESVE